MSTDARLAADVRIGVGTLELAGKEGLGLRHGSREARALLREALELGIRTFDTAWYYGPDVVNREISRTFGSLSNDLLLIAKIGNSRDRSGKYVPAVSNEQLDRALDRTLTSLDVDSVPLLLLRWRADLDETNEFEDAWSKLVEMQAAGKAQHIGLSNVSLSNVLRASSICTVEAVSNAYSILERSDESIFEFCHDSASLFIPYYPLNRGGVVRHQACREIALERGVSPYQVALAWLLRRSPHILPIPGTASLIHLRQNANSAEIALSAQEMIRLSSGSASRNSTDEPSLVPGNTDKKRNVDT